ncbi:hypothetical protein A3G55_01685 [Candidatus Giovannonibacteria bacterium RIFCSPLOWO2_12_FULL_44_25]|uniref:Uncharacterized protein n=2 Tax=Candidatus Giovannoniibacteriota TaxID=1752738 RepID=A0A1F5W6E0_9BACT|nr:MAG: hypothetical protein UW15_C0004G0022 [Parcubacteria group bacterium GW2011_GWC1_44_10]KKT60157.1 MAG: hypothetical protein UW53_C0003G0068 [Candidatus Giovannonibacteria bacterium GW2011_GWA1_44_25]KKU30004.1 MAG: hypothetical protein UX43_C0003G0097 [Candidatus Giovannonibacteria bacterium GW2011_GWB1_46_20]OGF49362.1 MAG: hypothetical protein A2120_03520 [Candidatus Giovannonibacteria bacterium GWA2_45_15]OGF59822.1 MAG: hypothetical protein A2W40_01810 [Candidatus Giovannonibacteria 
MTKFDDLILEISAKASINFDMAARVIFLTLKTLVPKEASKPVLADIAVNAMHECDRRRAVELISS